MTDTSMLVDHDLLISLKAEMISLRVMVEAHNIASVERDTRLETKVDGINGTVALHDNVLIKHSQVNHSGINHEASLKLIEQINEMWTVWSIGKYVGAAGVLALVGQTLALLILALRGGG